jgi:DNA-binding response OmpR family regulator
MNKKPTVLLIEDEAPAVFAIDKYFTDAGFSVYKAFSGQEGLKTALEKHPDVIVLDVMMPAESGLDMLPELRADPWGQKAKIIVFSNLSDEEHKARANKYNVDDYLVKTDISLKQLLTVVKEILPKNDY